MKNDPRSRRAPMRKVSEHDPFMKKPKPREKKKTTRADLSTRELAQLVKRVEQLEAQVDAANTRAGTAHDRCTELDERCGDLQDSLDGLLEAHDDEIIAAITAKQLFETERAGIRDEEKRVEAENNAAPQEPHEHG